jgi:hypothetical protein
MKTTDVAADIDDVRAALGVPQIGLYAPSPTAPTSARCTPRCTR